MKIRQRFGQPQRELWNKDFQQEESHIGQNGQALHLHNAQSLAGAIQEKHALKVLQLEAVI